ncbi:MAG: histone deacetylase [Deltaproteobacteria bacterium]|jgi:acetoin utilization deacetylase AcuC-like enzyme|nr:histone deacetylase [Deltaproteobacteria bacterium]
MAKTGLVYDDIYLNHDTGPHHPETAERLTAIIEYLRITGLFEKLLYIEPEPAKRDIIAFCHEPHYIDKFERDVTNASSFIHTPECPLSRATFEVARYAVGGVLKGVDEVMEGRVTNCFCAVRPPGHHAERSRAMGFCYFNNVAIAAKYLQKQHHIDRIMIIDWDVHHGNGTQHIFEENSSVFYISLHQDPSTCYPGTGWAQETGKGTGKGYTLNFPMFPGSSDEAYLKAMEHVEQRMDHFKPQFVLISAGFDAHMADPLAHIRLTKNGYQALTQSVKKIAETYAEGRIVSVLEGGYSLEALKESIETHINVLMDG